MTDAVLAPLLRRLRQNVSLLAIGALATILLGVATLAYNARALTPALFGTLALVQSYVVVINRIFSFDVWQGMIRFGAEAQESGDTARLRAICSFAILFDFASATLAGVVGLTCLLAFSNWMMIPPLSVPAAAFYVVSLFLQLPGAPIGLMRFFNRFSWITAINVLESAARLAAAVALYYLASPLAAYLYAYGAILMLFNLVRVAAGLALLAGSAGGWRLSTRGEIRAVGWPFVRFSLGSWITGTLNVTRRDGTTLVVAALLGPAGAGFYAVAQRVVRPLRDFAELLRQAAYPEISRLAAARRDRHVGLLLRNVLLLTVPLALATTLMALVFGNIVIRIAAGDAYELAYWPFVWLACAASLYLCTPMLSSLAILYTGMRRYVIATAAAAAVWALTLVPPVLVWGVAGAGAAEIVFVALWILFNTLDLRRTSRGKDVLASMRN